MSYLNHRFIILGLAGVLLAIDMCGVKMPKPKKISKALRKKTVDTHSSEKGFKNITNVF